MGRRGGVLLGLRDGLGLGPRSSLKAWSWIAFSAAETRPSTPSMPTGAGADDTLEESGESGARGFELDTQKSDKEYSGGDLSGARRCRRPWPCRRWRWAFLVLSWSTTGSSVDEQQAGTLLGEHALVLGTQLRVELSEPPNQAC